VLVLAGRAWSVAAGEWLPEPGARLRDAVSVEMVMPPDGRLRAFYPGPGGIVSAVSSDGLTFAAESGQRFAGPSTNPAVFALPD
jgi:hypothetical protein